jgi:ATP-dependent Clp protease ATP-binding subunit ClpC
MFERFSPRARQAIVRAQEESRLLSHNYIGTEHILLGLLAEQGGVAARALNSLDISLGAARDQVREIIGQGTQEQSGHIPFTPRAKKVLELSLREAMRLRSEIIGTEHLLLGLIAEGDGVGAQILERLGAPPDAVRVRVVELAGTEPDTDPAEAVPAEAASAEDPVVRPTRTTFASRSMQIRIEAIREVRDLLESMDRRLSAIERHLGIDTDAGRRDGPDAEPPASAE